MMHYELFGRVLSSHLDLPELPAVAARPADFELDADDPHGSPAAPIWSERVIDDDQVEWMVARQDPDGALTFSFFEDLSFRARRVEGRWRIGVAPGSMPRESLAHLLIDEVVPILLSQEGSTVLHGAAVTIGGRTLVVLGASGAGKSTLALECGIQGDPVLSDDCVVIDARDGRRWVQPSYPSVRAWPGTLARVVGAPRDGRPFAHYTTKLRVSAGLRFADRPAPVAGILLLEYDDAARRTVEFRPVSGHAAASAIMGSVKSMLPGERRAAVASAALDLAAEVPITRMLVPDDLELVPEVRHAMHDWGQSL